MWYGRISTSKSTDSMNRLVLCFLKTELGRRLELQLLTDLVTSSLDLPKVRLWTNRSGRALEIFSQLTTDHLSACGEAQHARLYKRALRLGSTLRRLLADRSPKALMQVVVQLYRNIGIDLQGVFPDEVTVTRCQFCTYYSPPICEVASLIDSGVVGGLYGAEQLVFTQRITEGQASCCCHLITNDEKSHNHR